MDKGPHHSGLSTFQNYLKGEKYIHKNDKTSIVPIKSSRSVQSVTDKGSWHLFYCKKKKKNEVIMLSDKDL